MPGRWLLLDVVLAALALVFAAGLVREIAWSRPLPPAPPPRASRPGATAIVEPARESEAPAALASYSVIAARSLFSAARSEVAAVTAAPAGPKPILHGVVVDGDRSRAYLEDPVAKRVFGYAVGDTVAGGRLEQISDDRVVIRRPEGALEVLLQDPSKPKPSAPAAAAGPQPAAAPASPSGPAQVTGPAPQPPEEQRVETAPAPARPRRSPAARWPIPQ